MEEPIHVEKTLSLNKWVPYSEDGSGRSFSVLMKLFRFGLIVMQVASRIFNSDTAPKNTGTVHPAGLLVGRGTAFIG
jgi:hypothetical protein